jgi:hypothetical protein
MNHSYQMTHHAFERATSRSIPPMIAELIMEYGASFDAGNGCLSYFLTRESMKELRNYGGSSIANAVEPYRSRNVYVIAASGKIVTMAYGRRAHAQRRSQ